MGKPPALQFYIGDWMKDPNLSMCSASSRGVWMDLLCAMHELDRSGRIVGTLDQISRLCRCTVSEARDALTELQTTQTATVTFRNDTVTVINRRMEREHKERLATRERVYRHRKKRECNTPSSSSSSTTVTESDFLVVSVREVFEYWRTRTKHLQAKLTPERDDRIRSRLKQGYTVDQIKRAIDGCLASPYHQGQNDKGAVYDSIELICRTGDKLEKFIGYLGSEANAPPIQSPHVFCGKCVSGWVRVDPGNPFSEEERCQCQESYASNGATAGS